MCQELTTLGDRVVAELYRYLLQLRNALAELSSPSLSQQSQSANDRPDIVVGDAGPDVGPSGRRWLDEADDYLAMKRPSAMDKMRKPRASRTPKP